MPNNFEPIKIKKAKENLIKNLEIAKENKHIDEERQKHNIFMMIMQFWYRIFRH
ncbi:hypothetical protein MNB_SV-9-779 [hydrothermal vent metagenome]|uniref:Uncharacterized protein n=1 Tax=hydrothermal vent metagenome TaxID=652676 RepID=A0A1W1C3V8_9ZZZZ